MERRSFIKVSSLITAALVFKPSQSAATNLSSLGALPESKEHVRHGDFRLEKSSRLFLPSWICFYKSHTFHENGFRKSAHDLNIYAFDIHQKSFIVGVQNGNFYMLGDEIELTYSDQSREIQSNVLNGKYRIQLTDKKDIPNNFKHEFVALVIDGHIEFDSNKLGKHDLIHGKNIKFISASDNALLLIISKL